MEMRIPGRAIIAFSVGAALLCSAPAVLATCEGGPCVCINRCYEYGQSPDGCPLCGPNKDGHCMVCDPSKNGGKGACLTCQEAGVCCVEGICCLAPPVNDCVDCPYPACLWDFDQSQIGTSECQGAFCGKTGYATRDMEVNACRTESCDPISFYFTVTIHYASGVCYSNFCDISGGSDPNLDGLTNSQKCELANKFLIPEDCTWIEGLPGTFANSLCIAMHEAYHAAKFEELVDKELRAVCASAVMNPLPVNCANNSCEGDSASSKEFYIGVIIDMALDRAWAKLAALGEFGAQAASAQCAADTGASIAAQWCQ